MANALAGNVYVVDESGALGALDIVSVKIVASASGDAELSLHKGASGGVVVYEGKAAATGSLKEDLPIRLSPEAYATLTGTGAKAYIYLK